MTVADLAAWELRRSGATHGGLFDELLADRQFLDPAMQVGSSGEVTLAADGECATAVGQSVVCELRQHAATFDTSWTAAQEGYLSASLTINSVPLDAQGRAAPVAVLRVHGAGGELAALRYHGGHFLFALSASGEACAQELRAADGKTPTIGLGDRFDCFLRVTMTTATVSLIHQGRTYLCTMELDRAWMARSMHFSAGVCFDREGSSGQAEVTFYSLASPSLPRVSRRSHDARRAVASAELVVRLVDGERLSFPFAVRPPRQVRH